MDGERFVDVMAPVSPLLPEARPENPHTQGLLMPSRVLLVESERIVREATAGFLSDRGFEAIEACDGDEAIKLLDGPDNFHVVFTAVQMPGKHDGVEVALHARRRNPAMLVLVASGYGASPMALLGKLSPPVILVCKPYTVDDVLGALMRGDAGRQRAGDLTPPSR